MNRRLLAQDAELSVSDFLAAFTSLAEFWNGNSLGE